MGTATYFSPEQAEGAAVDGRSDEYALGVVMYEMLVGRPPFIGDTPIEVSTQHVHGIVTPPTQVNTAVPRDLEAIVMKSLARTPELRYPTADELRADLQRFVDGQPVHAAGAQGAFFGNDSTQMVQTVPVGERTQAVPVLSGPRVDVKPRRRKSSGAWIFGLISLLLIAGVVAYLFVSAKHTLSVMPSLAGEDVASATTQLSTGGIHTSSITTKQVTSASVKKGIIVRTAPAAGARITTKSPIRLFVSDGPPIIMETVPSVIGESIGLAVQQVHNAKLNPNVQDSSAATCNVASPVPNQVLCETPAGSHSEPQGTTINLYILGNSTPYPVPNVAGDSQTSAVITLTNASLKVNSSGPTLTQCKNGVTAGTVVATQPAIGTPVIANSSIQLILSSGNCRTAVYAVVGRLNTTATSLLQEQGFIVVEQAASSAVCTNASSLNKVVYQNPGGGQPAVVGSTVTIQVCQSAGTSGATGVTGVTGVTGTTGALGTTTTVVVTGNNGHPGNG